MRPLPSNLANTSLSDGGNTGLWYDKYCDLWAGDGKEAEEGAKLAWIEKVTSGRVGTAALLAEVTRRRLALTLARGGAFGIFVTEGRFVTGLGRSHPVENGFAWHPALGTPYLPGSSAKGMAHAWASPDEKRERLFGSKKASGAVIFLDALPVEPVRLEADVMTPHYAGWSPDGDPENLPGDWRSPVPVPFLVTAVGNAFSFSILPAHPDGRAAVPEVFGWLRAALQDAGAGAKTSVGYGRFRFDEARTEALRKEMAREAAERTPEGRWLLKLEGKKEEELLDLVRVHLEKERIQDPAERRLFARAIAATPFLQSWRRGQKTDPATKHGSGKIKERAKLVDAELGPNATR